LTDTRPNIIFIITDQQRFDTVSALGYEFVDTPNLDRLVNEGVSFTHAYCSSPSCAPSRASLFTGYWPHTTGVLENMDTWTHSWVEDLNESGYRCVNVGKMHTMPWETPLGFHERYVVENKDRYRSDRWFVDEWDKALRVRGLEKPSRATYAELSDWEDRLGAYEWGLPEEMHPDNFVGDFASWWLDYQPQSQPLFMQVGFPGPHPPYDPVERYVDQYMDRDLAIQEFDPAELESQPSVYRATREKMLEYNPDAVRHLANPSPEQRHRQRAYYLANVTMIDEKVGEIMQSLENNGYLDNSVVIFTSDHGDALTDHGHSQKFTFYEPVVRVPCIVWSPSRFSGGRKCDDLIQIMDLAPTVLEMAGLEPNQSMEAQSLMPLLNGVEGAVGREYVFSEHGRDFYVVNTDFATMVRNREWKLVRFADHDDGILADMIQDPGEVVNLWHDSEQADVKHRLLAVLENWLVKSNRDSRGWQERWR
tara:strand:+ start:981 stop:2414 length:1434 start_codon:yes stop_codon:yes gene_type:complete